MIEHTAFPIDPVLFYTFLIAAVLIEITPGPNIAYLVTLTMTRGRAAGLATVAGITLRVLMPPRAGRKLIGLAAKARISGEEFKALNHAFAVCFRLCQTECLKPVQEHLQKVVIGVSCKPIFTHASARVL